MDKPLILDFIQTRKGESFPAIYSYEPNEQLNVIVVDGKKVPFIDSDLTCLELETKTRVHREADDDNHYLEMQTKTKVKSESDDFHHNFFLELQTKTFTKAERDDERDIDNYK